MDPVLVFRFSGTIPALTSLEYSGIPELPSFHLTISSIVSAMALEITISANTRPHPIGASGSGSPVNTIRADG